MTLPPASRSFADLQTSMRPLAERLLADASAAGIPLTVTCTLRSMALQATLYAQGRTTPGRIVTNARPGYSYHNFGLAVDVVPDELLALPDWGDTYAYQARADTIWAKVGNIGKAIGLRWGGDFDHLPDRPHFEQASGPTLAQLRAGTASNATSRSASNKEDHHA